MRHLIVNGDDLGVSPGVNRGIAEAHRKGTLTSASLMVNMPASRDGARLARELPALSVGLHADLSGASGPSVRDGATGESTDAALQQQIERFCELTGRMPTHVDSHHNVHRDPRLLPSFLDLAARYRLPLREHSPVHYVSGFYGQWGGETHAEQITVDSLIHLLEQELSNPVSELSCHPGYCDPGLRSSYRTEREAELATLCAPALRAFLSARRVQLVNFRDAMELVAGTMIPEA